MRKGRDFIVEKCIWEEVEKYGERERKFIGLDFLCDVNKF